MHCDEIASPHGQRLTLVRNDKFGKKAVFMHCDEITSPHGQRLALARSDKAGKIAVVMHYDEIAAPRRSSQHYPGSQGQVGFEFI